MTNSQVPRIEFNSDGTISIKVSVYGFDDGALVEVSGHASQENGAVATFYSVQAMPATRNNDDSADIWVRKVAAVPANPPKTFVAGFPVTVIVRVSEAWIALLNPAPPPGDGFRSHDLKGSGAIKGVWKSNYFGSLVAPSPVAPSPVAPSPVASTPASVPASASSAAENGPDLQLRHGKWWDRVKGDRPSAVTTGRFTRLFPDLPGARFDQADLERLAGAMTAPAEDKSGDDGGPDPEENRGLPAAYTYFGQFVDHDLTFDPISHLRERLSPGQLRALVDFRTPRFDLDSVYGRGPDDQPYLYEDDGVRLLPGKPMPGSSFDPAAVQLPRGPNGRALIGDPRNDENRIVAQLHAIFLRFHNAVVGYLGGPKSVGFAAARQQVQWHYQWILVNDFLPAILPERVHRSVFPDPCRPAPRIPKLREGSLELMPVEFSVAAYRFGHSMIRSNYQLNQAIKRPIFSGVPGDDDDLGGFRPIPDAWAIDWRYFIDLDHGAGRVAPQLSYKIDTSLVHPLSVLPAQVAVDPSSLALRNLMRGAAFQLPCGQKVAAALGVPPLPDEQLLIGKAIAGSQRKAITEVAPGFAGNAPLWAYILAEAPVISRQNAGPGVPEDDVPVRLGPVGGQLVAEVFASLLLGDTESYLYAEPAFRPIPAFARDGKFGLAELISAALKAHP